MKQKINPFVAVVVILAVGAGAGWLIYTNTQARMVDVPYKTQAQIYAETQQKTQGMRAGFAAMTKGQKAKPTGQAKNKPKGESLSGHSPKPEQKAAQEP